MSKQDDGQRTTESRRILDRISREADNGPVARASARLRDHVTAKDGDADDGIDRWGTRIGRALGLILTAALVIWLVAFLIRGG
jgi:hypothetical protein